MPTPPSHQTDPIQAYLTGLLLQLYPTAPLILFDSSAHGHYFSKMDRIAANLPILRASTKYAGVANGSTSKVLHISHFPFKQMSTKATTADSFPDFTQSLMIVDKTCDDGTISIFTCDGVTLNKEQDVLITCKGEPILIRVCYEQGRYHISLIQTIGHWHP